MDSLDVVLLERVGPGASPLADVVARLAAARLAGWNAQTLILDERGTPGAASRGLRLFADEDALSEALDGAPHAPRAVVIADREPAALASLVADKIPVAHWPIAMEDARDPFGARGRRTPPRWTPLEGPLANVPRGAEALDLAPLPPPAVGRGRLPLWDGDYVLAPAALESAARARLLEAFARCAAQDSALDLVLLEDPDPAGEALARRLGIGMRVHFAGVAPHDAETAWLASATAVAFGEAQGLRASLVLLALACGTPIVQAGAGGAARALAAWLDARGCGTPAGPLETALAAAVERGPAVERAIAAGRAEAARHAPDVLAARFGARDPGSLRAA